MAATPPTPPLAAPAGRDRQADVRRVAGAYAEHLLAGGVTTWAAFLVSGDVPSGGPTWDGDPPGAAHAELLRRLNRRAGETRPGRGLGERVLRRAAPGRGRVDLLLREPPEPVPAGELLRVGAGVLADLLAELPVATAVAEPSGAAAAAGPRRRGPTYRLEGPPVTVAALQRRLTAAGLPPGRRGRWRWPRRRPDVVLVVALPLRRGLSEVWSRRVQQGATRSWSTVLTEWHRARRLPPGVCYDRLAATWAARVGPGRVHVVTGDDLDGQVAAVLGRRPEPAPASGTEVPAPLPPAYVEVVRRTSEVLTFRVPPEERQQRVAVLVGLLAGPCGVTSGARGPRRPRGSPAVGPRQRQWLQQSGRRSAARLEAGGYVLHAPLAPLRRVGGAGRGRRPTGGRQGTALAAVLESVLRVEAARARADRARADRGGGTAT